MARRARLVLVSGLHREATTVVSTRLLGRGVAVVHHDLREIADGVVTRRLRRGDDDTTARIELAHGCVSCTLRHDLLPLVRELAADPCVERIVLHLDPLMEPEPVCWELQVDDHVGIEAVVTVVNEKTWLEDATGDVPISECGLGAPDEDDRTLAQIAVAQVSFADALVVTGIADAWLAARTDAVFDRLAPGAPRMRFEGLDVAGLLAAIPASARRGTAQDAHGALLRGQPPLETSCGVGVVVFRERRPFHPWRLHEAIDVLLDGVVSSRGRVWVASQPDVAMWLESAGGALRVGHAGAWLAALDDQGWDQASSERQAKAALDWDSRFGDRVQELVIVAHQASPDELVAALTGALLTEDELSAGEDEWSRYADPFGDWRGDLVPIRKEE